ncbi:hypothetical protein [Ancrocorticia populi]|uniref:hypothetical protein n=2 Tax=Ancrocorticia populi TaxID=2175228 RepID=UPI003F8ED56A
MGIRYYAYAFDPDMYEEAKANPERFIGSDPLADAWGFEPGATGAIQPSFQQALPKEDFLYLDKAWQELQAITRNGCDNDEYRPAHRMFEGYTDWRGFWFKSWLRTISPEEVVPIAEDLRQVLDNQSVVRVASMSDLAEGLDQGDDYVMQYLREAEVFVRGLASEGRGFVYKIG